MKVFPCIYTVEMLISVKGHLEKTKRLCKKYDYSPNTILDKTLETKHTFLFVFSVLWLLLPPSPQEQCCFSLEITLGIVAIRATTLRRGRGGGGHMSEKCAWICEMCWIKNRRFCARSLKSFCPRLYFRHFVIYDVHVSNIVTSMYSFKERYLFDDF